ncbi:MAG TPA: alpha-E domain-containing protein, partial [Acidimicrobiales bacterium]|nr:alpha-E domain-containing protein [Acidimicrobiales bacterium]
VGRIRAELEFGDVIEMLSNGLHAHLDRVQEGVRAASEALAAQYFRNLHVDLHSIGSLEPFDGG